MSKVSIRIWDREFELPVSYQNYPGEEATEIQEQTLESVTRIDFEPARIGTEQYIRENYAYELGDSGTDNLFRFIMPRSILICRDPEKRVFVVMCDFKFDMEHGAAIVYEDEQFKEVGPQDIIL